MKDSKPVKMINGEYDPDVMRDMINENRRILGMEPMGAAARSEREAFEGWANAKGTMGNSWNGEYYDNRLHEAAWQAWQAARAAAPPNAKGALAPPDDCPTCGRGWAAAPAPPSRKEGK